MRQQKSDNFLIRSSLGSIRFVIPHMYQNFMATEKQLSAKKPPHNIKHPIEQYTGSSVIKSMNLNIIDIASDRHATTHWQIYVGRTHQVGVYLPYF